MSALHLQFRIRSAAQTQLWLSALLCILQVSSMPTTCQFQKLLVEKSHKLLEELGGQFPPQCRDHQVELRLPTWTLQSNHSTQDVSVSKTVYKTFMKLDVLMENQHFPQTWNLQKLDNFQNLIYRQIRESQCILAVKAEEDEDDSDVRDAALTEYFNQITKLLIEQEFSVCMWERARNDLLHLLRFILKNPQHFWTSRV